MRFYTQLPIPKCQAPFSSTRLSYSGSDLSNAAQEPVDKPTATANEQVGSLSQPLQIEEREGRGMKLRVTLSELFIPAVLAQQWSSCDIDGCEISGQERSPPGPEVFWQLLNQCHFAVGTLEDAFPEFASAFGTEHGLLPWFPVHHSLLLQLFPGAR
jgi:hypothetical protein